MLPYRDSRLTYTALGIFFVLVLGYGYYEARGILFGPSITIASNVTEVHDPFVSIKGQADRIASLAMNGKTISVTETGAFDEPYLLAPGYNRVVLSAWDKYGRGQTKAIEIVYTPDPSRSVGSSAQVAGAAAATAPVPMSSTTSATVSTTASTTAPAATPASTTPVAP